MAASKWIPQFLFASLIAGACQSASSEVLSDGELLGRGARIGAIVIQVDDVFEETQPLAAPYRIVNKLKINSRQATIAAQLLFKKGDAFDRRVLDESERVLRGQRYLNAATIEATDYHDADNTVDLVVRVHDVWTLSPGISFGRKGGANNTHVEIEENNFLGFGKRVQLSRSQDVDRTSYRVRYEDPNVLGSWWRLETAYASTSDGGERTIDLERPFYSLDSRWSAGVLASDITASVPRYHLGQLVEQFDMRKRQLEFGGGLSEGLRDGWVRRYLAGMRYDQREFSPTQPLSVPLPQDRTVAYPWLGIELLEDNFRKSRNLDLIGRTEDIHLGFAAVFEVGYASPAFGSTDPALVVNSGVSLGSHFGDEQYLFNEATLRTRVEKGTLRNATAEFATRYYLPQNNYSAFFSSGKVTLSSNLDPERQLTLGGDNGLRGYPLRYQSGDTLAMLTVEERFYTHWQPFKLFDVGAAVFADAGRTWGQDVFGNEPIGLLADVGVGLRLGNARSALGNVLHIDLAFPLKGSDLSKMQVVVETKRSF